MLVEDDEDDYVLFLDMIFQITTSHFHLDRTDTYESALEALSHGRYDICFLDYRLGAYTGLEILPQAATVGFDSPIIFLTGQGDYRVDVQAMEAGAADYLVKGEFNSSVLERVIRYSLARRDFQRALKKAHDELEMRVKERTSQLAEANQNLQQEIKIRHAAEKALQESENRLNAIIRTVPDIIYRVDTSGIITFISNSVAEYGYSPGSLLGKPIIDMVHHEDRMKTSRYINKRRPQEGRSKDVELRLLRGDKVHLKPDEDVISKENDPVFLLSAEGLYDTGESGVRVFIGSQGILRDITVIKQEDEKIRQLNSQLEHLAMTDDLTGLANRRFFYIQGNEEIIRAQRYQSSLALMMLDIDRFKNINDKYGHDAGDRVLQYVAQKIRETIREVDVAARMGGEEFCVLLPNTKKVDALILAERLRLAIEGKNKPIQNLKISVTVSIGVTENKKKTPDLDALLRNADAAMYQAKNQGRNKVICWPES